MSTKMAHSGRRRTYSSGSDESDRFISINERPVDDISLDFFYRSHTISLFIAITVGLVYFAFTRDENESLQSNIQAGMSAMVFFFLIISTLAFPNGPFTRPHPALWRCIFGLSVMYLLMLLFLLFQDYKTVRGLFIWFYPELQTYTIDMDKGKWGEKCDDFSFSRLWESIDFFCFAHLSGWAMKTLLIRHYGVLWTISIMWEITEVVFSHLLPNFKECWWDSMILDVLVFNGLGIWFGMQVCHWMEMRYYTWESIKDIHSTTGKLKRAALQFTPYSWNSMSWLDPSCTTMRIMAVCQLVIFWQVAELNTFFLKHIFQMPPNHPLVFARIFLIGAIAAPSIRQYYSYMTDPRCKRVGTQCWVFGLSTIIEALICMKFGADLFQHTQMRNVVVWILIQLAGSILCLYVCVEFHKLGRRRPPEKQLSSCGVEVDPNSTTKVSDYLASLSHKTVTLTTPEEDSTADTDSAGEVRQRRKQNPLPRRSVRLSPQQ